MNKALEIGRLLRAGTTGCVLGCAVSQLEAPQFGGMVNIPLENGYRIFGLIYDIRIDDDGLVRQLVTSPHITEEIVQDNRLNRNVPVEISALFIGYEMDGKISHLLPPRPPLALDAIYPCSAEEIRLFCSAGRFGYFRHILRSVDLPIGELLAAHLRQANQAFSAAGDEEWMGRATQELIVLLRDDYSTLMSVLGAIGDF